MKVSTAAGGNVAEAMAVSSTSHSPPPQCAPLEHEPAAKAPILPVPELQTSSAVSMTAALKNVGAVSTHLQSSKRWLMLFLITLCRWILWFADHSNERRLA